MKRLSTGVLGAAVALAAIFFLPRLGFLAVCIALLEWAAFEFVRLARRHTPRAPLQVLLVIVPLGGVGVCLLPDLAHSPQVILSAGLLPILLTAAVVLLGRAAMEEALVAAGLLSFGTAYLVLPIVGLYGLRSRDPWLLVLLCAMVWLGDSAAYYVGSAVGRHKMAPAVSPNKSWEGAAAGFVAGIAVVIVWSLWRLDRVPLSLLGIAALALVAAQVGDLVESMMKRGVGVKDSGDVLPGHGGILDRMDALLFSAPVFYLGLQLAGGIERLADS